MEHRISSKDFFCIQISFQIKEFLAKKSGTGHGNDSSSVRKIWRFLDRLFNICVHNLGVVPSAYVKTSNQVSVCSGGPYTNACRPTVSSVQAVRPAISGRPSVCSGCVHLSVLGVHLPVMTIQQYVLAFSPSNCSGFPSVCSACVSIPAVHLSVLPVQLSWLSSVCSGHPSVCSACASSLAVHLSFLAVHQSGLFWQSNCLVCLYICLFLQSVCLLTVHLSFLTVCFSCPSDISSSLPPCSSILSQFWPSVCML